VTISFRTLFAVCIYLAAAQPAPAQGAKPASETENASVLASPEWQQFVAMVRERALRVADVGALERTCVASVDAPSSAPVANKIDRCIGAAAASLEDPATFMDANEAETRRVSAAPRPFGSIGIEISRRVPESGPIVVASPLGNSPAERAGILPGDAIDTIDGVDITSLTMDQAVLRFRGKPGIVIDISLLRGDPPRRVSIAVPLAIIRPAGVTARVIRPHVLYARIRWLNEDTPSQLVQALRRAAPTENDETRSLLLDLRGCAGGELAAALATLSWFIPAGTTVGWERTRSELQALNVKEPATMGDVTGDMPTLRLAIVVLIDGRTASGAELFAQALHRHRGAPLVGEHSAGMTAVRLSKALPNGSRVSVTEGELLSEDKTSWKGRGLEPDLQVPASGTFEYGGPNDRAFERALREASAVTNSRSQQGSPGQSP
jgi:carboxyl-terminal processing protease